MTHVAAVPTTGCEQGRHELRTPRLLLRSPTLPDLAAGNAGGSDPEAQRWLGFPEEAVVPEPRRGELLAAPPGGGEFRDLSDLFPDSTALVAADPAFTRHVGSVGVEVPGGPVAEAVREFGEAGLGGAPLQGPHGVAD
ncbi:hypothetical protein ACWD1X_38610, partial [Streptomyces sp. NPDC003006]